MGQPVLSANSPSAGYISWSSFGIAYSGVQRVIPAGNTNKRFVWWRWNAGNPAAAVVTGDALPTDLTPDDLVLFVNRNGIPVNAQSANVIEGSLISTESIIGDSIAANTITGTKMQADTLTAREIQAGAITAAELSISSWGGYQSVNGDMEDVDPVTKVPAGWSAGFERSGTTPTYSQETMQPLSGSSSTAITIAANSVEGLASAATPVKAGDLVRFGVAFRTSVTGVPVTLRAYFSATKDFTNAQLISGTPETPTDVYIFDVSGAGLTPRDDIPNPLAGPGIAAMVEGWPTPVTTPLFVSGQFRVPAGAQFVRFVLASGLTSSSPAHTVIWDALEYDSVVTGIKMADGAITAEKLAVGSVTADAIAAGAIQTEHLSAGLITADMLATTIVMTTAMVSGVTGRRWEFDPDGWRMYDDAGAAIINFPTDTSNGGNTIKGDLTATVLTVEDNLKIMGLTNEVSKGSRLVLSSGTTSPSSSPTLTVDWESYGPTPDKTFDPYKRGLGLYNGKYYYAQDVYGQKTNIQRMDAATGAREWYGYQFSTVTWAEGGLTVLGGTAYALGKRSDGTTWAVDKFNLSTNANAGSWVWSRPSLISNEPAIGNDGTNILIGWTTTDGSVFWQAYNPSTGAQVGAAVLTNGGTSRGVTAIMGGNFDYGSARVIMQFKDAPEFGQVFNSAGVRQTNDEWMLATGAKPRGATWDSVRGQFVSYDPNAAKLHFYTGVKWTTESSTWWASYTWANPSTSSETQQSTRRSITMKKRARLLVSLPARPVTDAAVTHSRVYLGRGGTDPARTAMWKQGADITGTTMLLGSVAFSGTNPPSASSFTNSSPARVESGAGNLVLNGDGSGSAGAITWGTTATSATTVGGAVNVSGGITSSDGNGGVLIAGSLTTQGEPSLRLRRQSSNGTDQYEGYIYMWSGATPSLSLQQRKNGTVTNRLDITDGYTSTGQEFRAPKIKAGSGDASGTNYAEVYRNTAQACGTGVWTTISFNTWGASRFEDDGGIYSSSHWRSNKAGFFVCSSSVTFATAGTGHRSMRIITEGGTVLSRDGYDQGTTPFRDIHTAVACALPGGAYGVRTEVYQNSGASINTSIHSSTEPCISRFGQCA